MSSTTTTSSAAAIAAEAEAAAKRLAADPLGYDVYADTLWQRIEHALNRSAKPEAELGDDPLVVGIFGEWGAGKSYLLSKIFARAKAELVRQKLEQKQNDKGETDSGDALTVPVWFQPWKYEHEEFLHVPLLLHVMNALKDALREPPSLVGQMVEAGTSSITVAKKIAKPTGKMLKIAKAAFPIIQKLFGSISVFGIKIDIPDDWGEWLEAAADAAEESAGNDDDEDKEKKRKDAKGLVPTATHDGLYFYRIHELMAALTRPGKYAARKDLFGNAKLTKETNINFVVFVDDLDRCLPEKAVAVLELIKTVFNVDSFAFVLALDDEVIERGIGHRYREYMLKDKKPQMPITGFEYLEKIVHLPFRLPALTEQQAMRFIESVESPLEPKLEQQWFRQVHTANAAAEKSPDEMGAWAVSFGTSGQSALPAWWPTMQGELITRSPQLRLTLKSFDGYVPRKLLRIVELWHQICRVSRAREGLPDVPAGLTWTRIDGNGSAINLDTRVIFSLVLLQLFQPELFRFMRRRIEAFPALLGAFLGVGDGFKGSKLSDIDLWSWASHREAAGRSGDKSKPRSEQEALARIAHYVDKPDDDSTARAYLAQRVRMGLAERLVEHFAAQRHVFNPLKLFEELALQLGHKRFEEITGAGFSPYFGVLAQIEESRKIPPQPQPATDATTGNGDPSGSFGTPTVAHAPPSFDITDPDGLFAVLISPDIAGRANIQERFALQVGRTISTTSAALLGDKFLARNSDTKAAHDLARFMHEIGAINALAPWLSSSTTGKAMLAALVGESNISSLSFEALLDKLLTKADTPVARATVGDLLNRFPGGDPRFRVDFPFLFGAKFSANTDVDEPLPGFVRISKGPFNIGHATEERTDKDGTKSNRNPSRDATVVKDFYIARTLTTVAQYERFVTAGGYDEKGAQYWDAGGREAMAKRNEPNQWSEQRAYGNRPVTGISWFEARAYARWLDEQMRAQKTFTDNSALVGYSVKLPTETQWERAARASQGGVAHQKRWPWSNDAADAVQYANIRSSGIGHVSSIGVFKPTELGLYDVAGNAWEWMDNLYAEPPDDKNKGVPRIVKPGQKLPGTGSVSLRGGSWFGIPEVASCSYRSGALPVDSDVSVGVRVVLSLAE